MSPSSQERPHRGGEGVREVEYGNKQTGPWGWGGSQKNGGGLRQFLLCVIIFASPPAPPPNRGIPGLC